MTTKNKVTRKAVELLISFVIFMGVWMLMRLLFGDMGISCYFCYGLALFVSVTCLNLLFKRLWKKLGKK